MDFANRNRPAQQPAPQKDGLGMQTPQAQARNFGGGKSMDIGKASSIFVLVATAVLVLALIFALVFNDGAGKKNKEGVLINPDKYQAVFLNSQDGQVYFGKLAIYNDDLYVLSDIYYVRVENPIQPEGQNQQQQANISLAKLGNELHAPEDVMYISREKVLYWENLKDDGQVVKAITKYKADGGKTDDQTNTQQNTNNTTTPTPSPSTPSSSNP